MNHGILHFGKLRNISAKEIGEAEDSGNGYYSYSYYVVPFTGKYNEGAVYKAFRKKYPYNIFTSLGFIRLFKETATGGEVVFCHTYHHGD